MLCPQHSRLLTLPFPHKSVHVPLVMVRDGSEESDREWMEVESLQDIVDQIGSFVTIVDPIECVARSLDRQCWDAEGLAVGGDGGDPGCDAETHSLQSTQLLHDGVYLFSVHSLRVENGFRVVENDEDLP